MHEMNIDPTTGFFELEFSASVFMCSSETIQSNLRKAAAIGFSLAIDNFGKGFSCLSNLKDVSATKLKLGRSFTMGQPEDDCARTVLKVLITMGKDLGMTVIAEGKQIRAQMEILKGLSVDGMQGYFYAKQMAEEGLFSWLSNREAE